MKVILRDLFKFSTLNTQYNINKSRNAVRFESQNISWNFEQVNYQSVALSKGLASLSFQKNDNFLMRLPSAQQTEAYIAKLGTAGIGANLILSTANTTDEIAKEISNNNVKGIFFEPTINIGDNLFIDVLNQLIPELTSTKNGQKITSKQFSSLKALIQTNFYSYPGVYKFRSILNYADDKYFKIPYAEQYEPIALPSSNNTLFVTQPASEFGFRAGVLNSNINGRYVVVVQPKDVNRIAEFHQGKVDLIASEEISNLNPEINAFVAKGSDLLKNHGKRTQI